MTHKQSLKLHVRLIEPKEKLTPFPVVGGAGGGYNPQELSPGGRLRRLTDIHRGTVGFCQMEKMADTNWMAKRNTKPTLCSPHTPPDANTAGSQGRTSQEVQENFPSVLRMLQSPRPWGESSSNNQGRSASTVPLMGRLRTSQSPGTKLKTLRPEVSKSSSSLYCSSSVRPHRARYCLLPSPEPLSSRERLHASKMASYGAHRDIFVHRATVMPHTGKSCFTLTHMSSDNGLLHVIKPPVTPVDSFRHHWEQDRASPLCSEQLGVTTRERINTPGVLSRLDRILYPGTRRVRDRMASAASEEPSIGSGAAPAISTLLSELGEDAETRMEDLEAVSLLTLPSTKDAWSAYSSSMTWTYPEHDIEQEGGKGTLEVTFMFPQEVRMGKIPLPRSYNMNDPVDVPIFLEHLPDAFVTLAAKCELWLQTCPINNYTLAL